MMRRVQNLVLKNKLVLLAAVTAAVALLVAGTGFIYRDLQNLRLAQIDQLRAQAEMLALNASRALSENDHAAIESVVTKLKSLGKIDRVYLFDASGRPVNLGANHADRTSIPRLPEDHKACRYSETGELELFHPIVDARGEVGVVSLTANSRAFGEQATSDTIMIAVAMLCSLVVALLAGSIMQSRMTMPNVRLAAAARKITTSDDDSIRVATVGHDELDVVYESFNRMVERIQSSKAELKQARDEMESRVHQRTQELQDEIVERERIQRELVRAKESAEAASESKSRFLANVSHEIRTPLNAILGFADYILRHDHEICETDRGDYMRIIKKSGEGLLVLINDILDLSKIEAGQMDFEKVRFSPHSVISEVASVLRPKAREKNLCLEYHWSGPVPDSIESDPVRFRQLLMNLIGNAVKFSEVGRVDIIARVDQTACKLRIDVVDTGIGIPPETLSSLFKPFTQGDSSVTRRFGGTGLGLSICKNIVKGLGGDIRATSEPGEGSIFTFTIDTGPMEGVSFSQHPQGDVASEDASAEQEISLSGFQILVADDGEINRKLIHLLLHRAGAEVVLVENGLDAVNATHTMDFDLILLDMQMPVMDGYTAAARLREEGFTNDIVALTAHAMRGDAERCLEAGCSEYLTKPIRQELLLATIHSLITHEAMSPDSGHASRCDQDAGPLVSQLPIEEPAFAELVCEFIEQAQDDLAELYQSQREGNYERLAKLAHRLKGSGGMAGFPSVTEAARTLESYVKMRDAEAIDVSMSELAFLIEHLQLPV